MNLKRAALLCSALLLLCGCSPGRASSPPLEEGPPMERIDRPGEPVPEKAETNSTRFVMARGEKRWELDLSRIGYDGVDPTSLDRGAFARWLSGVEEEINRPPKDAHFEDRRIVPHENGLKLDRGVIEGWLDEIHEHTGRVQEAPVQIWKPRITTATLQRVREKKLSSYTTRYNPYHRNRTHNIALSTTAIDHRVIPVGEVFSFNGTVGMRIPSRGYRPAPVIVRGEYTEGIGGGICQTSSTLFNSVERAGLRILQRVSHSKHVTYVPAGQDATVSWGGPDFRFQNQLNRPILVKATARRGFLTVEVYGPSDTVHRPRPTPEPPRAEPRTEEVPSPREKQPLNEKAREYRNKPLPRERLNRRETKR